jgi:hypothetical protein
MAEEGASLTCALIFVPRPNAVYLCATPRSASTFAQHRDAEGGLGGHPPGEVLAHLDRSKESRADERRHDRF